MENHDSSPATGRLVLKAAAALAVVAAVAAHLVWATSFWSAVYVAARFSLPYVAGLLLVALFAGLALQSATDDDGYVVGGGVRTAVATVTALALAVAGWSVLPYETDVAARTDRIAFVDGPNGSFEARFPVVVADGLMSRSVGDVENVRVGRATFTAAPGQWSALVSGVGALRPSQGVSVKTADGYFSCDWDVDADASFVARLAGDAGVGAVDGMFGNRLRRQLLQVERNVSPDLDSLGAWCADDGPYVVVPATRPEGLLRVRAVPAGVFVIDPSGEVTFRDEVAPGEFPVPVISEDVAARMVDANRRLRRDGDVAGWRSVFFSSARVGYERPERADSGWSDDEVSNPDFGNAGEFLLRTSEGRWVFVTPLTPVGSSETIVALAVVAADVLSDGVMPEVVVHRLPEELHRRSNVEVEKFLRTEFDREVQWEAGYAVFELAPLGPGAWSATIGQSLEVKYRALVYSDGSACLTLFRTGETVRCSGQPSGVPVPSDRDEVRSGGLDGLSEAELLDLLDQVVAELRTR